MTAPSVPRKRASKPKVRTGCDTCKKRRVKCDERKPRCLRCERLHHDCRYATHAAGSPKPGMNPPHVGLVPCPPADRTFGGVSRFFYQPRCYTLNEREAPYFDAYRQRIAQRLGYTELWYRSVLRESARDPVIRHCVIALGALSQVGVGATGGPPRRGIEGARGPAGAAGAAALGGTGDGGGGLLLDADSRRHYDQACLNYGEALTRFRDRVQREGAAVPARTVLLTSLLFLALEQMQGNTEAVQQLAGNVVHMLQGKLMTFWSGAAAAATAESAIAGAVDDEGVAEAELVLPRIFVMNLRSCHVDPHLRRIALRLRLDPAEVAVPDPRAPRLEIKRAWDRAVMRTTLYTERCRAARRDPTTTADDLAEYRHGRTVLLQRLDRWESFARALLATEPPSTPEGRILPILMNVILASLAICQVSTLSCLDDDDDDDDDDDGDDEYDEYDNGGGACGGDRYHDHLRRSVEHAEEIIDALDWPLYDSTLSPVVHCVLQRSRDPDLRRRATVLFRRLIAHDRSVAGAAQRRRWEAATTATTAPAPAWQMQPQPMLAPAEDRASSEESDGGAATPTSTASSSCATLFSVSGTSEEEGGYGAVPPPPRPGVLDTAAAAYYRDSKGGTAAAAAAPRRRRRLCMGHLCLKTAIMDGSIVLR